MNFLAHARLSFFHPPFIVGNLISDFVKGKRKFTYSSEIQRGIQLHRLIDTFTDGHEATQRAKEIFRPAYRLYCGPIVDVLFDYFLANFQEEFTDTSLMDFSQTVYRNLHAYADELPPAFLTLLPHMEKNNWLYNYQFKEGIYRSLQGLSRRSLYLKDTDAAEKLFLQHIDFLNECFISLWKNIKPFAFQQHLLLRESNNQ